MEPRGDWQAVRWWLEFAGAITITDNEGVILAMNDASARHYASFGGRALIGTCMLDCHPEPARTRVAQMLANPGANVYTIEKAGARYLVHQSTWFDHGAPGGLVEIILALPADMAHLVRDGAADAPDRPRATGRGRIC